MICILRNVLLTTQVANVSSPFQGITDAMKLDQEVPAAGGKAKKAGKR